MIRDVQPGLTLALALWRECAPARGYILAMALLVASCGAGSSSPVCIGGASMSGGKCKTHRAKPHYMPFREGFSTRVQQAFHGYLSHKDDLAYSVDFQCDEGTPIVASQDGVVWSVKEDSESGCGDRSCMDEANYVILDNGDGTYSEYYHLRHLGVLVEEGQSVCRGQVIALCGNTGFSTGPHLHFSVTDTTRRTVPFQFVESRRQRGFGFPIPDAKMTSRNRRRASCGEPETSSLGRDAFAAQGIVLNRPMPLVVRERDDQKIRGRYYGDYPRVALHRKSIGGGSWLDQCVEVQRGGRFEFEVEWPRERWRAGRYWVMMTGADSECQAPGWNWSYKLWLR